MKIDYSKCAIAKSGPMDYSNCLPINVWAGRNGPSGHSGPSDTLEEKRRKKNRLRKEKIQKLNEN